MKKKATLKTIASDLGLSTGTVLRVLNGKAKQFRISEEIIKKVMDYAWKMDYPPNLIASNNLQINGK